MLTIAKMKINSPIMLNSNMGSIMHGLLMQHIDADYATYLHKQNLRPYTQQIYFDKDTNQNIWRITTLNKQAYEHIILPLQDKISDNLPMHLKQKNIEITAQYLNIVCQNSYENIVKEHFTKVQISKKYKLNLLTPTNFKSNGQYLLYPQMEQVIKSLFNKWNAHSGSFSLDDSESMAHLIEHIKISGYELRSRSFSIEGIYIPAFIGRLNVNIRGAEALIRIANTLFDYANYSGIGIKTALGMGRCYIEPIKERENNV